MAADDAVNDRFAALGSVWLQRKAGSPPGLKRRRRGSRVGGAGVGAGSRARRSRRRRAAVQRRHPREGAMVRAATGRVLMAVLPVSLVTEADFSRTTPSTPIARHDGAEDQALPARSDAYRGAMGLQEDAAGHPLSRATRAARCVARSRRACRYGLRPAARGRWSYGSGSASSIGGPRTGLAPGRRFVGAGLTPARVAWLGWRRRHGLRARRRWRPDGERQHHRADTPTSARTTRASSSARPGARRDLLRVQVHGASSPRQVEVPDQSGQSYNQFYYDSRGPRLARDALRRPSRQPRGSATLARLQHYLRHPAAAGADGRERTTLGQGRSSSVAGVGGCNVDSGKDMGLKLPSSVRS